MIFSQRRLMTSAAQTGLRGPATEAPGHGARPSYRGRGGKQCGDLDAAGEGDRPAHVTLAGNGEHALRQCAWSRHIPQGV